MKLPLIVALALFCTAFAAEESKPLSFEEVYSLIKTNLSDVSSEELSRSAALGLIKELGTKVQLVTTNEPAPSEPAEPISRRAVYNDSYGYIAIRALDERLPEEFQKAVQQLVSSNALKGMVIDLRYAQGEDYEVAAKIGDTFVKGGEALLSVGGKEIRSTDKSKPVDLPVAVLVNAQTRGAAEALAAVLRETGVGLIIGSKTAGEARLFETFTLSTGQKLKVGKIPVEIGDHKAISSKGITPDIAISVLAANEKILYQDPYRTLAGTGQSGTSGTNEVAVASTNRSRRFNEAELVRRHREGADAEGALDVNAVPDRPVVMDPALARALDFLKGIAVLQQHRPL